MVPLKRDFTSNTLSHRLALEKRDELEPPDDEKLVTEILQNGKENVVIFCMVGGY
jgi:hypothetical protein